MIDDFDLGFPVLLEKSPHFFLVNEAHIFHGDVKLSKGMMGFNCAIHPVWRCPVAGIGHWFCGWSGHSGPPHCKCWQRTLMFWSVSFLKEHLKCWTNMHVNIIEHLYLHQLTWQFGSWYHVVAISCSVPCHMKQPAAAPAWDVTRPASEQRQLRVGSAAARWWRSFMGLRGGSTVDPATYVAWSLWDILWKKNCRNDLAEYLGSSYQIHFFMNLDDVWTCCFQSGQRVGLGSSGWGQLDDAGAVL